MTDDGAATSFGRFQVDGLAFVVDDGHTALALEAHDTLHEIAGGMPRGVIALARLARLLLDEEPALTLDRGHVESLHRRLSMTAA